MNKPVSVGNIKKMDESPPPIAEQWRDIFPAQEPSTPVGGRRPLLPGSSIMGGFGNERNPIPVPPVQGLRAPTRVPTNPQIYGLAGQTAGAGIPGVSPTPTMSFADYIASLGLGGGGGGAVRPDYSAYRTALTDQAAQLNARIQAMYNQLAEQAGANVARVQDIYGGATQGIGSVYDESAGNVQQAFESAQQQAADQLARLGIEAAAEQVLPTQALAQAQALAGLEAGRASGLSAAERYGASGAQFGSEMAQTAQQQGTEMNAAILASLQNRLNESLAAEMAGGGGGGGGRGMSVSDMLRLQQAYRSDVLGEPSAEQLDRQFRADQIAAENVLSQRGNLIDTWIDIRGDYDSDEEAWQAAEAAWERANALVSPGLR